MELSHARGKILDDAEPVDQNPHYVHSVTEMGEENDIVAQEDIFAANGMKLLAKGARINRRTLQRLGEHKLKTPLDVLLVSSNTLDETALARDIDRLLAADPILSAITVRSGDPQGWKALLGGPILSPPIAFRLTVMRDGRNDLYLHSLRIAVVAHCMGMRLELPYEESRNLFLAALCHDFGEMHTDPAILAPGHRIDSDEQRFIYVHPVTGYVVLQQMNCVAAEVMQAVRQHHERLDGSGYPYGEAGTQIGQLARILAVSETLEAVVRRFGADRVNVVLRLSQGRLDQGCIVAACDLLPAHLHQYEGGAANYELDKKLARLANVVRAWDALQGQIGGNKQNAALQFVSERISGLQSLAIQAGLARELLEFLDLEGNDASMLPELNAALEEIDRLLDSLALEIDRRVTPAAPCRGVAEEILAALRAA